MSSNLWSTSPSFFVFFKCMSHFARFTAGQRRAQLTFCESTAAKAQVCLDQKVAVEHTAKTTANISGKPEELLLADWKASKLVRISKPPYATGLS